MTDEPTGGHEIVGPGADDAVMWHNEWPTDWPDGHWSWLVPRHEFVPGRVATAICQAPDPFGLTDRCYLLPSDAIHDTDASDPARGAIATDSNTPPFPTTYEQR
jgi:hypothetical protein